MEIKVFDKDLNYIGLIDNIISFTSVSKYNQLGSFKIKGLLTEQTKKLLSVGNFILNGNYAGYIHSLEIDLSGDSGTIEVNGYDLLGLLQQRIVWETVNFKGSVEDFIRKIINENCINCDSNRVVPFLTLGAPAALEEQIEKQVSYENLLYTIQSTLEDYDLGIKISMQPNEKQFIIDIYKGEERTIDSNNPIVFNREFENIDAETYINSLKNYNNAALIGGTGEGAQRALISLGDEKAGFDRYEVFVDARNTDKGEQTQEEYEAQLKQKGSELLSSKLPVLTFEVEVNNRIQVGYSLGDKVTILDKSLDIILNARITAIEKIFEGNKETVNLTFGKSVPSIYKNLGV